MLNINGIDLEIDIMDADFAEKYQRALIDMKNKEKEKKFKGKDLGEIIRFECGLVFDFFDSVFGEGTAKKIFGDKTNYRLCQDALEKVVNESAVQTDELMNSVAGYSPERAARK